MSETDGIDTDERLSGDWRIRLAFITFVAIAVAVVWVTNQLLTERFTETTRNRAEVRLALYTGNLSVRTPAELGRAASPLPRPRADRRAELGRLLPDDATADRLPRGDRRGLAPPAGHGGPGGRLDRPARAWLAAPDGAILRRRAPVKRHGLHHDQARQRRGRVQLFARDRGGREAARRHRGRGRSQEVRGVLGRVLRRRDGHQFRRGDHPVDGRALDRPDRGRGADRAVGAVGHRTRAAGHGRVGGAADGRLLPRRLGHAAGDADRLSGLAHDLLHDLRQRAGACEHLHRPRDHGLRDSSGRRAFLHEPPRDEPVPVLPAGVSGTPPAQRRAPAGNRREGTGREEPPGGRTDAPAVVETGRAGRDVGEREPRTEPAAGRDEDLPRRRAAPSPAQAAGGGAVVVPADRRPDRADGRDHAAAQELRAQGRRRRGTH